MDLQQTLAFVKRIPVSEDTDQVNALRLLANLVENGYTPPNRWSGNGEPDPHGDHFNGERACLAMGDMTDDELANGMYMCDHRTSFRSIHWLTAGKERIRWLSRALTRELEYHATVRKLLKELSDSPKSLLNRLLELENLK